MAASLPAAFFGGGNVKNDEMMILSQLMLDSSFFHDLVIDEDSFLRDDTRKLFRAIKSCIAKGKPVDLISIADEDASITNLAVEVSGATHSAANWKFYEAKIKTAYDRKRLYDMGRRIAEMAKDAPIDEMTSLVEYTLMSVMLDGSRERVQRLEDIAPEYIKELKERFDGKGALRGIASGFGSLDEVTHGFQPRRLYYVGARPSQGKSALMANMAAHIGLELGIPCGIISIESSGKELIERIYSCLGNIPADMLATGFWGPSQMQDIVDMSARIKGKPFFIYDKPNLKLSQVKSVARVMKNVFGARIIFIDYLQLIRNENPKLDKTAAVMESSQAMKEIARELELPVVCLAQLGRDADEKRPTLANFQWASQIEQDADVAIMIWHKVENDEIKTKLLVEKNRDGKKKDLDFRLEGDYYRFMEAKE
jgi:replicative DNA helicase